MLEWVVVKLCCRHMRGGEGMLAPFSDVNFSVAWRELLMSGVDVAHKTGHENRMGSLFLTGLDDLRREPSTMRIILHFSQQPTGCHRQQDG